MPPSTPYPPPPSPPPRRSTPTTRPSISIGTRPASSYPQARTSSRCGLTATCWIGSAPRARVTRPSSTRSCAPGTKWRASGKRQPPTKPPSRRATEKRSAKPWLRQLLQPKRPQRRKPPPSAPRPRKSAHDHGCEVDARGRARTTSAAYAPPPEAVCPSGKPEGSARCRRQAPTERRRALVEAGEVASVQLASANINRLFKCLANGRLRFLGFLTHAAAARLS